MDKDLLVDISVGSRFHAFDLARELQKRGAMRWLYTGYPGVVARKFGVDWSRVRSVPTHEILNRIAGRLYQAGVVEKRFDSELNARFDCIVAKRLRPGARIYVGWSSQCLETLRRARAFGATAVVERGSTHIAWQRATLLEEMERTGVKTEAPSVEVVERECREYEEADYVVVPSQFALRTFVERGFPEGKLLFNPYGVNARMFTRTESRVREFAGGRPRLRVIHVGRVSIRKGVHDLVAAIQRIEEAELTLVGAVDPGMERLIRAPRVRVVGSVPAEALPRFYADAEVFCLLSVEEGMAMVVAQAMASGLPVVVTPNTGAGELMRDGADGFIVPARDPETAAAKLAVLAADDKLRVEMGASAAQRVRSGFTWADYGQRAWDHYRRITGSA